MRGWYSPNHPGQNKWSLFSKATALEGDAALELGAHWVPSELAAVALASAGLDAVAAEGAVLVVLECPVVVADQWETKLLRARLHQ